ncbi:pentapeptide repeat-containing protein [Nonomuraea terrae]|uniref:pentapeptide repeat-containing protein n=1 Tax=Nonomuraea terrae TaxID=2530383 RepID=UPI001404751B|nr:pentapeptide repeat-containing protein [Nonomuraea terrae]
MPAVDGHGAARRHWPDIRLDLDGATLIRFDLTGCRFCEAGFDRATFTGTALGMVALQIGPLSDLRPWPGGCV